MPHARAAKNDRRCPNGGALAVSPTLSDEDVEFIVVGAHAVMFFTEPRYTKDLDVYARERLDRILARSTLVGCRCWLYVGP